MEHPQHSNRSIFPNKPNITEIFMGHVEDIKSFKLRPSANISNLAFGIELMLKLTDKKVFGWMEHPKHSNQAIFSNMPNITEIFMDHVEDIKSFKLGPSATISNLTFGIELMLKLTDKKVLMDHPQPSNRSIFQNIPNITEICMDHVMDIKSFKLGTSANISNLAFGIELMLKLTDKKVLMEHPQHSNRSIFPNMSNITEIFIDHVKDIKSLKLGPSAKISNLAFGIDLMLKLTDKKVLMDGTSSTL